VSPEDLLASWPSLAAAAIAALVALGLLVVVVFIGSRIRLEWMWVFFVGVLLSMVVTVILQKRDLRLDLAPELLGDPAADRASQVITLLCLAIAFERSLRFVFRGEYARARGGWMLLALMLYIVTVNLVAATLGSHGGASLHLLYAPLFTVAVFAYAQDHVDRCVSVSRNALFGFMLVSLAFFPFKREMVAEPNYAFTFIPGLTDRFYGFANHANTLAPLCFVLMVALFLQPFARRWLTGIAWLVAWVCMVLTQSKTSIGLAILLVAVLVLQEKLQRARERDGMAVGLGTMRLLTGLSMVATLVVALSVVALIANPNFAQKLPPMVDTQQVTSFTGRTTIWRETLKVVRDNPLFGYGPGLWDVEFQRRTGMPYAHAHSQYVQTLGAAGAIGLATLFFYLVVLLRTAWRARIGSRGVSLALVLFVIIRGITEVPLSVTSAMQGEFFAQMFMLAVCVGFLPARERRPVYDDRQWAPGVRT
jgi:O-antigen ligase